MSSNRYFACKPAAVLRVTGEDAPTFLQSQFSNDLRRPAQEHPAVYGLWLDRKGKVRADSFILRVEHETFLLISYHCEAAYLQQIVEENIIADDVEVEDLTEGSHLLSCWGPGALNALERGGRAAKSYFQLQDDFIFPGRRSKQPCAELLSLDGEIIVTSFLTEGDWYEASEEDLEAERIRSCIPRILQDIGPVDLPQEGGLEKDAVSFNKGCYLGQEVMARLHAMGKPTRGLYPVSLEQNPSALPAEIRSGEKKAGELRSAVCAEGQSIGLALLKHRAVEEGSELVLAESGTSLRILTAC